MCHAGDSAGISGKVVFRTPFSRRVCWGGGLFGASSGSSIGVNRPANVREIPHCLAYFPHFHIFARTSRISGFISK